MNLSLSVLLFIALILFTGGERIYELVLSRRNAAKSMALGGIEYGQGHFPFMALLHTALLLGAIFEVVALDRPFIPAFGWALLGITIACQFARYWIIWSLGSQWNTRVIVIPGAARVKRGPYAISWLRHPNYLVVVIEGLALPLVHSAWITAIAFTVLNAILLLGFRLPTEKRALESLR